MREELDRKVLEGHRTLVNDFLRKEHELVRRIEDNRNKIQQLWDVVGVNEADRTLAGRLMTENVEMRDTISTLSQRLDDQLKQIVELRRKSDHFQAEISLLKESIDKIREWAKKIQKGDSNT
jgi:uncharacterized coiled-coil DUF342 family protein